MRFLSSFFRAVGGGLATLFTGGRYGASVRGERSFKSSRAYEKRQEQRHKDFVDHGGHPCKICNTRIPANHSYCGACYNKYVKK
jgi:hypothetical protein